MRHINLIRDSADLRAASKLKPLALLARLAELVSLCVDIAAIAAEMIQYTKQKNNFSHEVADFTPLDRRAFNKAGVLFHEIIREGIEARAKLLQNAEQAVRSLFTQYGSVLSARANIKLQRSMSRLTWLVIALTIPGLALSALMAHIAIGGNQGWADKWHLFSAFLQNLMTP